MVFTRIYYTTKISFKFLPHLVVNNNDKNCSARKVIIYFAPDYDGKPFINNVQLVFRQPVLLLFNQLVLSFWNVVKQSKSDQTLLNRKNKADVRKTS